LISYFNICFNFFLFLDNAIKLIAKIRQCEIIVRDTNRIHHFRPNGQCSCNDYFWKNKFFCFFFLLRFFLLIWIKPKENSFLDFKWNLRENKIRMNLSK
jgi:hypothetical protein